MALPILIALDATISRAGETLYARAGTDEAVMMSVAAGRYYGLNAVALRIWELLERPMTIAGLCALLCEEFEVDAQTCEIEVLNFVNELIDNDIAHAAAA
ncbi:MAG: PqqD family peptide modification chaperone [Methylocella sp.]